MNFTYYGHSTFQLETKGQSILIDPFISGNPHTDVDPTTLSPNYIILTHAHGDHVGDTEVIAKGSGATIVSSFEIANYFAAKDLSSHGMNPGGSYAFEFGTVKFTPAWHSSSFPDGTYGGMPMGVIIESGGKRAYHAGDTALFSDMSLIGRGGLDIAFLPIGSNFTMGPEDALEAAKLLKAKHVIPIHYDTFDLIKQDAEAFKRAVEQETSSACTVLKAGEVFNLD